MLPEQQQRIMGYFIEEAKDHLNTIEQGLLNLQTTIEDPELVNEVFRAAHSVKGGAAMLGLTSIQQTAHRLEDSFKVLKECSVKVDQQLESLFLRIFDTLQGLLEQLSGPFGLTEELGEQMVRELEPVFEELNGHLGGLVGHGEHHADDSYAMPVAEPVMAGMGVGAFASSRSFPDSRSVYAPPARATEDSALLLVFDSDVPARMRELLQEFKQPEGPESRRQLKNICRNLLRAGEEFELPCWIELIQAVSKAIANPENTYRTLAPTVIKDIKQAQELVISGLESSIVPSAKLLALQPAVLVPETDFEDLLAFAQPSKSRKNVVSVEDEAWDLVGSGDAPDGLNKLLPTISGLSIDELFDQLDSGDSNDDSGLRSAQFDDSAGFAESDMETGAFRGSTRTGPEVGAAELNTLADLFDGESPDLDGAWEEEEDLDYAQSSGISAAGMLGSDDDNSGDFTDLLFDEYDSESSETNTKPPIDDLTSLFGEDLLFGEEAEGSAVAAGQKNAGSSQRLTRKQVKTGNGRGGLERRDDTVAPARGQADEDALGTLLDEVAAQTSAGVTDNADFDNLFGDLGLSEATGVPAVSSEYSLNSEALDGESKQPAAGGGNNDSADAEALALPEMDDFELFSELGEDSDLSELLGITSNFLSSEDEGTENGGDRDQAAGIAQNEEMGNILNMTSNSDLDISADENWLEDAFGLEDESVQSLNLELDDTDLDALFGDMTSGSISEDEQTVRGQGVATSREAADLAELFGSVPTGTEYDGEASGQARAGWLNDGDSQLLRAGVGVDEGDLGNLFDNNGATVSDQGLANSAEVKLGPLSEDRPESEISNVESDEGAAFDFLEDMFAEGIVQQGDAGSAPDDGATVDVKELSARPAEGLFDEVGADLFDRGETDAAGESEGEDDLFDALETDFLSADLEPLPAESLDGMFEGDADLLSAMETGATLNNEELEGFDDLLDSLDAEVLVTSELTTGFWDAEDESAQADSSELEEGSLADFFAEDESGAEDDEGNFDDLEALLIAGGAGAVIAASGSTNQSPVNTEVFSDLEELLSESATMPEIPAPTTTASKASRAAAEESDDEFGDLEKLLEDPKESGRQGEANMGPSAINRPRRNARAGAGSATRRCGCRSSNWITSAI
ncbi:Hpt protein [Microcoleus vaginatus FGP-2]|nr:Hpt protein [Microcoleus vaginatus FGP-2]